MRLLKGAANWLSKKAIVPAVAVPWLVHIHRDQHPAAGLDHGGTVTYGFQGSTMTQDALIPLHSSFKWLEYILCGA